MINSSGSGQINIADSTFNLSLNLPQPPSILPLDELQKRLKDNYLRCEKDLYRVMISLTKLSIENCIVNIVIVEKEPQSQDEKKTPMELNDLFNPRKGKMPKRLIIFGRAGIGKSTLTQKLVYEFASHDLWKEKFNFIFKIKLRNLTESRYKSSDIIMLPYIIAKECFSNAIISKENLEEITRTVAKILNEKAEKILIILDGLDEFNQQHSPCASAINELINYIDSHEINLLVTSRPFVKNFNPNNFNLELECIGFSTEDIRKYITFKEIGLDEQTQQKIFKYLEANSTVESIVQVPLMLDIFCSIWKSSLITKENMTLTNFYQILMKKLWETYDRRQEAIYPLMEVEKLRDNKEKAEKFLEKLAFHALQAGEIMLNASHICKTIEEIYNCDNHYVKPYTQPLLDSGFLCSPDYAEDKYDDSNYYFPHLTFQEYFAATHFYHELGLEKKEETKFKLALDHLAKKDLNSQLIVSELAIVEFLAEMIKDSPRNQERLLNIVKVSKKTSGVEIAAANAITVLNYAAVSFAHMDLSDIKIPGADLSYSLCYSTDFQQSDLSNVNFQCADLTRANLENCQMNYLNFGEFSSNYVEEGCIYQFSPDLTKLLIGKRNGEIKIFNLITKQIEFTSRPDNREIKQLCWDAEKEIILSLHQNVKTFLFSPYENSKAFLIDQKNKSPISINIDETNIKKITSLAFNVIKQKTFIAVAYKDFSGLYIQLLIYENNSFTNYLTKLKLPDNGESDRFIASLAFNENLNFVICSTNEFIEPNNQIGLYHLSENNWCLIKQQKSKDWFSHVQFHDDNKTFVSLEPNNSIKLWDTQTAKLIKSFGEKLMSYKTALCYEYPYIAAGDCNGDIFLWKIEFSKPIAQIGGGKNPIRSLKVNIKDNLIVSVDSKGYVNNFYFNKQFKIRKILSLSYHIDSKNMTCSLDGNIILEEKNGILYIQDTQFRTVLNKIKLNLWIYCTALTTQGTIIVSASQDDNYFLIIRDNKNEELRLYTEDQISSILITPDEQYVIYTDYQGKITAWDLNKKEIAWSEKLPAKYFDSNQIIAYCPQKEIVVLVEHSGSCSNIILFNKASKKTTQTCDMEVKICKVLINQSGDFVVGLSDMEGFLYLWQCSFPSKKPIEYNDLSLKDIAINKEATLIIGALEFSILIWQREREEETLQNVGNILHPDQPLQVFFYETVDKLRIVSLSKTGSIRRWEAPNIKPLKNYEFKLISENGHRRLSLKEIKINGAKGLSSENFLLLQQRGAKGSPSPKINTEQISFNSQQNNPKAPPRFFASIDASSTKLRKGLKNEAKLTELLRHYLPAGSTLGKAQDKGDCFFDSLAQCLNRTSNTDVKTDKLLRMMCHDYYEKNKALVDKLNLKDYGGIDNQDDYSMVQYTADECNKSFGGRSPIWGRPFVEGIMLCNQLNLRGLCIIEILEHPETKEPIPSFHWVNRESYTSINKHEAKERLSNPELPTLVVEQNSLHFVPLLSTVSSSLDLAVEPSDNYLSAAMK